MIIAAEYGNGVVTSYVYNPASGAVESIESDCNLVPNNGELICIGTEIENVQALEYDWDLAGNLTERRDQRVSGGLTEHFYYDSLYRLDYSTLAGPGFSGTNLDLDYDAAGNITSKSGVGSYAYNSTWPHAVTDLVRPDSSIDTFTYDANGNLESGGGRSIDWTSYNYPRRIEKGSTAVNFAYGPNRQRYKEVRYSGGSLQSRRLTINRYFEQVEENGKTVFKHYIHANGKIVAVHDRKSDFHHATHFLHQDHLGSVDTITDEFGNVVTRTSFDAFGQRRGSLDWTDGIPGISELEGIREVTSRGYTEHQMLDDLNLIHMNGRVYDPELGRFISADPFIPDPFSTQSFNRYSYVQNNPLAFVDPSGFIDWEVQPQAEAIDTTGGYPDEETHLDGITVDGGDAWGWRQERLWEEMMRGFRDMYGRNAWNRGNDARYGRDRSRGPQAAHTEMDDKASWMDDVREALKDHLVGTLSVRGGFIFVGALDVTITADALKVYLGAGVGAGLSASASAGVSASTAPQSPGLTTKAGAQGGFGGAGRATFTFTPQGASATVAIGTGGGLSASATTGYTWVHEW